MKKVIVQTTPNNRVELEKSKHLTANTVADADIADAIKGVMKERKIPAFWPLIYTHEITNEAT